MKDYREIIHRDLTELLKRQGNRSVLCAATNAPPWPTFHEGSLVCGEEPKERARRQWAKSPEFTRLYTSERRAAQSAAMCEVWRRLKSGK